MTEPETDRYASMRAKGAARKKASRWHGDLDRFAGVFVALIEDLLAERPRDERAFDRVLRRHPRPGGSFAKSDVVQAWRQLAPAHGWPDAAIIVPLRMKPVRTGSGVAPLTLLTRPHPCPGRCVFCPSDVQMPKSYLAMEPGAQRGTQNAFHPYRQTWNRLRAFANNGHPIDKVELIILGGTFSSYPLDYQIWFVQQTLAAMNEFDAELPVDDAGHGLDFLDLHQRVDGSAAGPRYNEVVTRYLREHAADVRRTAEHATCAELIAAQRRNESAAVRCVGLSVETRPDCVDEAEAIRLRELGVTKVQLGIQSLDDAVLRRNQRGHDLAATRRAIGLLRRAGFKIQGHWMPNLLGATPAGDRHDCRRLFDDPQVRPDELKIYPTCLIDSAELMHHHRTGEWQPYAEADLLAVLEDALLHTPRWCRISRVIRDIPSHDILAGNRRSNLREDVERRIAAAGRRALDIRARQIRRPLREDEAWQVRVTRYAGPVGVDHFLEAVTAADELLGFARLFLPAAPSFVAELGGAALLREVHVYGPVTGFEELPGTRTQHRGVGQCLIADAAALAAASDCTSLAVISAIGTRDYYRRLGFVDGPLYQHLALDPGRALPVTP